MIKHFDVWPINVNKNDLFEEQKIFIIYLTGFIPEKSDWALNVEYQKKLSDIKGMTIKEIILEKTDIDLADMQGRAIESIKKERLQQKKEKLEKELNEKYGVEKEEKEEEIKIAGLPENEENHPAKEQQQLWEMLNLKGLTKPDKK